MNRPNMPTIVPFKISLGNDDYKKLVATFKEVSTYIDGLEKYCNELEKQIEDGYPQHLSELCDIKDKKISKLEKALDKACDKLEESNICPHMTQSEWKEWSMKDE